MVVGRPSRRATLTTNTEPANKSSTCDNGSSIPPKMPYSFLSVRAHASL